MSDEQNKMIVLDALGEFTNAIANKDVKASVDAHAPDSWMIGALEGEVADGHAAMQKLFGEVLSEPFVLQWVWGDPMVKRQGSVIWFFVEGTRHVRKESGEHLERSYRCFGVLRQTEDGPWKWAMFGGAEPAFKQPKPEAK